MSFPLDSMSGSSLRDNERRKICSAGDVIVWHTCLSFGVTFSNVILLYSLREWWSWLLDASASMRGILTAKSIINEFCDGTMLKPVKIYYPGPLNQLCPNIEPNPQTSTYRKLHAFDGARYLFLLRGVSQNKKKCQWVWPSHQSLHQAWSDCL